MAGHVLGAAVLLLLAAAFAKGGSDPEQVWLSPHEAAIDRLMARGMAIAAVLAAFAAGLLL